MTGLKDTSSSKKFRLFLSNPCPSRIFAPLVARNTNLLLFFLRLKTSLDDSCNLAFTSYVLFFSRDRHRNHDKGHEEQGHSLILHLVHISVESSFEPTKFYFYFWEKKRFYFLQAANYH